MGERSGSGRNGRRLLPQPPGVRSRPVTGTTPAAVDDDAEGSEAASIDAEGTTAFDKATRLLIVTTGVAAWVVAGLAVLVSLTIEPRDGLAGTASLFKASAAAGWLAIGWFVLRDARARRRRTLAVGLAAWAWIAVLAWLVAQTGPLSGTLPA